MTSSVFDGDRFLIKRKLLVVLGGAFTVYDGSGGLAGYARQAFKLREDIRLYTDESRTAELLHVRARQIVDFSAAYDVVDPSDGSTVGTLRRRGFRSVVRDLWTILDASGAEIGTVEEESATLALVRRFLTNLIPQSYHVTVAGRRVAVFNQRFNPIVYQLEVDFSEDRDRALDRRLGLAAAVLLAAVEGRQSR